MKRLSFLFLLAAILIPVLSSQSQAVDLKKGGAVSTAPGANDFAVTVNLLGEKGGVYAAGKDIRISFQTTSDAYVIVYDVDAEGNVQLLYPEDGRPVLTEGRKTYFLPPVGSQERWETGATTGVEYIHAIAVADPARLDEGELDFLSRGGRLADEKRLRLDMDPFLGFNMIDEEIVRDAESDPPATDYTYFYVNREVDYPRYLCAKCHSAEKVPDPYAMQCPEIVIEKIAYEEDPHYPYPPLYDIAHVGEKEPGDAYTSDAYADKWLDSDEDEPGTADDTHLYLNFYSGYASYPYTGPYLLGFDPFYWDVWGGFYWGWWDPFWWPTWNWWYPGYDWGYCYHYPWWGCGDHGWGHDDWARGGHGYRPIYGDRDISKKHIEYARTNTELRRDRSLAGSRLLRGERGDVAARLGRSNLERRSVTRSLGDGAVRRVDRSAVRDRELDRRVIYGRDARGRSVDRAANRTSRMPQVDRTGRVIDRRSRGARDGEGRTVPWTRGDTGRPRGETRDRGVVPRERRAPANGGRDVIRSRTPESTRSRPSGSTTHDRSRSVDRSTGSAYRSSVSPPSRGSGGYQRSAGSQAGSRPSSGGGRGSASAPSRSSSSSGGRTRSR